MISKDEVKIFVSGSIPNMQCSQNPAGNESVIPKVNELLYSASLLLLGVSIYKIYKEWNYSGQDNDTDRPSVRTLYYSLDECLPVVATRTSG